VKPRYPDGLQTQGTVVLQGLIGLDGRIAGLDIVSSTHADFSQAAVEAVSQWEFDQTLLNGCAIEVPITVTANFSYRP
jgi:TonB family protein